MTTPGDDTSVVARAGEDLFNFAIDREDTRWLMERLPREAVLPRSTVEYELQLLKIISVGWSIHFHLETRPQKEALAERYWQSVQQFSRELSSTAGMVTGQEVDYFSTLKARLDMYLEALARQPHAGDPAQVIGPCFAAACGNAQDLPTFMAGSKMFLAAVRSVREYLVAQRLL
jgi:hypothetical protein